MAVDRMESESWSMILSSLQRLSILLSFSARCSSVSLEDLQCKDVLVVMTQSLPCSEEEYQAMN